MKEVRCAAQTLQLAVEDAIASCPEIFSVFNRGRAVVKQLRTSNVMYLLRVQNLKKPIIDTETRWHSKHDMLERLLMLQSFCQEIDSTDPHVHLSEKDWEAIQFIVQALEPAKEATKKLQSELLTLGIAIIHV